MSLKLNELTVTNTINGSITGNAATATSATDSTKLPLAGGTMTGSIIGVSDSTVSFNGGACSAASYNYILSGANDGGNKLVVFVNGTTRIADGGVDALTIRNDGGAFILGSSSYLTSILGSSVTINGNAVLTSASTLTAGNLSGTIPSGVLGNSAHFIGTTSIALNRPSTTQSLTGVNIDGSSGSCSGNAATATYARRLDDASRTSFTVGGNKDNYYPVIFNIGSGATALQYSEFVIERGGYEEPGYTFAGGNTFSTLNIRFSCKSNGWGYGASYENVEMHGYTTQLVANWQQMTEASKLIVWLRGATIYYFWNVVGNTTLHDGNSGGTSLTLENAPYYSYTYTSTTTVQPKAQYGKYINSSSGISGIYVAGNVLAEGSFNGPGTGLTGTAASLTVGTANSVAAGGIKSGAIEDNAVIFSKIQQVTGPVAIGRTTASLGNVTTLSGADLATIIGANTITNATNATSAGSVTNGVYTTGNQSIAGNKTFTGITTFDNTSDNQIVLNGGGTTWAGIGWTDVNGTDYVWFNGQNKTFAIGGGGSNVSGKKLHVDGGVTIGADYDSTVVPSNGLSIQGGVQIGNYSTYVINALGASGTQSRTFEIARLGIDYNDWNNIGTFEVELHESYYSQGLKKVYNIWYGYNSNSGSRLVEWRGIGDNNFQCRIGSQVQISGDSYYLPVYVDVRYYSYVDVVIKTNRTITTNTNPSMGYTYINIAPTPTNISDFTADSDLEISTLGTAKLGGNTILTSASTSASSLSIGGNAETVTNGVYTNTTNTITGIKYFQSNLGTSSGALENPPLQAYATGTNAAFMSFHRGGSYAVNMGLDSDNILRIGGWSASANRLQLDMNGHLTVAGNMYASFFYDSDNNSYYANPSATSNFNELTLAGVGTSAYGLLKYGGTRSGDWQSFTNIAGQINVIQVENIAGGSHSNYPTGVYAWGGVMSWRTANHSFQLYAAHTGDLAYKTQWNNDNYSGWRRILDSATYPHAANMDQYVRSTDSPTFADLSITGAYQIRSYSPTITFRDIDHRTGFIHVNSNIFYILTGAADSGNGTWSQVANSRWPLEIDLSNNNAAFGGIVDAISFTGAGTGLTGTAASLSIGGNAATATNLTTNRTNWSTNGTITAVVGQLSWKHYGNNHTIIDASNSTAPDGTAINNTNPSVAWTGTYPTLMGWNGSSTYGVRVDSSRYADQVGYSPNRTDSTAYPVLWGAGSTYTIAYSCAAITIQSSTGTLAATAFSGSGASLTSLTAGNLSGTVAVGNGGTGATSFTAGRVLLGNGTTDITTSANLFYNTGTNRLGVGTTTPGYTLDVGGACHASSFPTSSDIRFKKNIQPLTNALQTILSLRGVKYEWNNFIHSERPGYELNAPVIGMIAQEVEDVIPEIVGKWILNENFQDARSLEYQRIIPYLIEAVKELDNKNKLLEARILALENK